MSFFINDSEDTEQKEVVRETKTGEGHSTQELEINRKNREDFENLMKESSTQLDGYWDRNNVFVKLLLGVLGIIIVIGVIYYVMAYMGSR